MESETFSLLDMSHTQTCHNWTKRWL